jgi:hypothetical protein
MKKLLLPIMSSFASVYNKNRSQGLCCLAQCPTSTSHGDGTCTLAGNIRRVDDMQQQPHATIGNPHCLLECLHLVLKSTNVIGAPHWFASLDVKKSLILAVVLRT